MDCHCEKYIKKRKSFRLNTHQYASPIKIPICEFGTCQYYRPKFQEDTDIWLQSLNNTTIFEFQKIQQYTDIWVLSHNETPMLFCDVGPKKKPILTKFTKPPLRSLRPNPTSLERHSIFCWTIFSLASAIFFLPISRKGLPQNRNSPCDVFRNVPR